jgi:hypothetical protein
LEINHVRGPQELERIQGVGEHHVVGVVDDAERNLSFGDRVILQVIGARVQVPEVLPDFS